MKKLLTVVVPTYQTERFIRNCLTSLLQSKWAERTEILVIDDGSFDQSGCIAEEYAKQYPQIVQVIHKENGGHGSTINVGVHLASGKYFRVVDSDDSVNPLAYEAYLKKLEQIDCDLVVTPFLCVQTRGGEQILQEREVEGSNTLLKEVVLPFRTVAEKLHIRIQEWTIRTKILKEQAITLSEHSFYVDMQWILFPIPWIETICILPELVYRYRLGEASQSVSIQSMQRQKEQHRAILRSLIVFYQEREASGERIEVLQYLARGIAKMEANQVQITLSLPIGRKAKQELIWIEQELKETCFAAYQANEKKSLYWLRNSTYWLYPFAALAWRVKKREKIRRKKEK